MELNYNLMRIWLSPEDTFNVILIKQKLRKLKISNEFKYLLNSVNQWKFIISFNHNFTRFFFMQRRVTVAFTKWFLFTFNKYSVIDTGSEFISTHPLNIICMHSVCN